MKSRTIETEATPEVNTTDGTLRLTVYGEGVDTEGKPAVLQAAFEGITEAVVAVNHPSPEHEDQLTAEEIEQGATTQATEVLVTGNICACARLLGDAVVNLVRRAGWPNYTHIMEHIMAEVTEALEEDTAAALARQIAAQEPGETPEEMN